MYQKWPDQIFPIVNFVFSHYGHFGLGRGGGGFGGGVPPPPPLVFNYSKEALPAGSGSECGDGMGLTCLCRMRVKSTILHCFCGNGFGSFVFRRLTKCLMSTPWNPLLAATFTERGILKPNIKKEVQAALNTSNQQLNEWTPPLLFWKKTLSNSNLRRLAAFGFPTAANKRTSTIA